MKKNCVIPPKISFESEGSDERGRQILLCDIERKLTTFDGGCKSMAIWVG